MQPVYGKHAAGMMIIHTQRAGQAVHNSEIEINTSLLEISQLTVLFCSAVENFLDCRELNHWVLNRILV